MIRTDLDNFVIMFYSNLVDHSRINFIQINITINSDLALWGTDFYLSYNHSIVSQRSDSILSMTSVAISRASDGRFKAYNLASAYSSILILPHRFMWSIFCSRSSYSDLNQLSNIPKRWIFKHSWELPSDRFTLREIKSYYYNKKL